MSKIHRRGRIAVAGILAAAALGSAAPAQAASEWWNDHAWPSYYERCVAP